MQSKLVMKSKQDTTVESSAKVVAKAKAPLEMEGASVKMAGKGEVKMEGASMKLEAKGQFEAAGAMVKVAAKGQLALESNGMAELKGSMTSVSGQLVKLG